MTMRVTMRNPRRSEDGLSMLLAGTTYTVSDDYGKELVQGQHAVDTDNAIATESAANRDQLLVDEVRAARGVVSPDGNLVLQRVRPRRSLKSCWMGRMQSLSTGAANHTSTYYRTLETHTDRIRIGVFNPVAAELVDVKVNVSTSDTMPGLLTSLAGSTTTTGGIISGGASVTSAAFNCPAGTDAEAPSLTWSPWLDISTIDRIDGGTLPLIRVRIEIPGASNANRPAYLASNTRAGWENPDNVGGRVMKCRSDAALGATTVGSGASTAFSDTTIPYIVEYMPRTGLGVTGAFFGDSISEAVDTAVEGYGWAYMAREQVSTLARPVEVCMLAMGSALVTDYRDRLEAVLSSVDPDAAIVSVFTPNGITAPTFTATGNARLYYRETQRMRQACQSADVRFVAWSGVPMLAVAPDITTGYKDVTAASAVFLEAYMQAWLAGQEPVIDAYTPLVGGYDADGQAYLAPGAAAGNLHLTAAGHALAATPAAAMMQRLVLAQG